MFGHKRFASVVLALNFVYASGGCLNPEQGMCQGAIFFQPGGRRSLGEKTYRKAVINNELIYFIFIDRVDWAGSLRKIWRLAGRCAMMRRSNSGKGATRVDIIAAVFNTGLLY